VAQRPRVVNLNDCPQFVTKDGSKIREIIAPRNSLIERQSLAEAVVPVGGATHEHYHAISEEIYFILAGAGEMRIRRPAAHSSTAELRCTEKPITAGTAKLSMTMHSLPAVDDSGAADDEMFPVRAGDAIAIPPGTVHKIWNRGDTDLVFLCLCTPPYEHDDTIITE